MITSSSRLYDFTPQLTDVVLCELPGLDVARLLGALVEQHLDVLLAHVLLDLLDPLEANTGWADNEGSAGLHLLPEVEDDDGEEEKEKEKDENDNLVTQQ